MSINDQMPIFAYKRLVEVFGSIENKNIVFLGVSYRGDVGDTRYSPVEPLFVNILKVGANIRLHDPFVSFWGEQNIYIESNIDDVLSSNPDLIILSTGHSIYRDEMVINKILDVPATNIFDTIGLFNKIQLKALQKKHKVSVLGRGDIL